MLICEQPENKKAGAGRLKVPVPNHYAKMRLFLHQQLHHHFSGVCNRGTRTEDDGNTGLFSKIQRFTSSSTSKLTAPLQRTEIRSALANSSIFGFVVTNSSQSHLIMFLQKIQCSLHD